MPKFCEYCGAPLQGKVKFCPSCGTEAKALKAAAPADEALENNDYEGERVRLCKDGKYRWKYEMNMLTNPSIFLTVLKVFEGIIVGIFLFFGFILTAAIFKGKYIVLFEMDEKGVAHVVTPEQMKKARKLAKITAAAGAARGSFTTAGAGVLAASKQASISEFAKVRRVKPRRRLHVIKVNEFIEKNQIYVPDEDFDFVYDYIKSRCVNAKLC